MKELAVDLLGELDLSQISSRVGWELMKSCRGEARVRHMEIAKVALDVCAGVEAAQAVVTRARIEGVPGIANIPRAGRRMLLAESARPDISTSKYRAICNYARKHSELIEDIASGQREPTLEELDELREHFASLSLVLAQAGL